MLEDGELTSDETVSTRAQGMSVAELVRNMNGVRPVDIGSDAASVGYGTRRALSVKIGSEAGSIATDETKLMSSFISTEFKTPTTENKGSSS